MHSVLKVCRPNKLSDEQINKLKNAVKSDPNNFGYNVWDGSTLSDYIESEFGINYGVRACQNLLHRMGFSLIRPQTYPSLENPDDEARADFKKTVPDHSGRKANTCVSRRGAFPSPNNNNKKMG